MLRGIDRITRWYEAVREGLTAGQTQLSLLDADWDASAIPREVYIDLLQSLSQWERLSDPARIGTGALHALILSLQRAVGGIGTGNYQSLETWAESLNTDDTLWDALLPPLFRELYAPYRGPRSAPVLAYGYASDAPIGTPPWGIDATVYAGTILRIETGSATGTLTISGSARTRTGEIVAKNEAVTLSPNTTTYTLELWVQVDSLSGPTGYTLYPSLGGGRLW